MIRSRFSCLLEGDNPDFLLEPQEYYTQQKVSEINSYHIYHRHIYFQINGFPKKKEKQ
jgi:hypothetical protein